MTYQDKITPEMIERINQLARKKKAAGLTEEEKAEQQELYRIYIAAFRRNLKAELDMIKIDDGKKTKGD